jgi:hypothetical protein
LASTGGGGGAGMSTNGSEALAGPGGAGGSGLVAFRYITATKPSFTYPTNAYLNVGMTETFTTNVAVDSATASFTRTFRWESSTAGVNGPFSSVKAGTGASNAAFSWVPTDTSTSGSNYLYRVVVTDSDSSGLSIQDTSTSVFAVINQSLLMTGATTIKKTINVTRNENYTISQGTPTYSYTLTPIIPGITLDTSTVGTTILKIADTATVGTYLETLTVTDSVTGTVVLPITIVISAPPTLTNTAEIITTGQIFNIDASNSASYSVGASTLSDISGSKKPVTINNGSTYSTENSGILKLSRTSNQYVSATAFTKLNTWTVEAFVRLDAEPIAGTCFATSEYAPTNINFALCMDVGRTFYTGYHDGGWTYKRSTNQIPLK